VHQLLERGADVNAEGGFYGNALQAAAREGHIDIVQHLSNSTATDPVF
jgi:ankyrin repeat protein